MAEDLEGLASEVARVMTATATTDEDVANALRREAQGLGWPETYAHPDHGMTLRTLARALSLRFAGEDPAQRDAVLLLDRVCAEEPSHRLGWRDALVDGVWPAAASDPGEQAARRSALRATWATEHGEASEERIDARVHAFFERDDAWGAIGRDFVCVPARPRPDVPHPFVTIARLAWREGLHLDRTTPRTESTALERMWSGKRRGAIVVVREDPVLGVWFAEVRGDAREDVARRIAATPTFVDRGEILAALKGTRDPAMRVVLLREAALTAPSVPHDPVVAELEMALDDPDPAMREAALVSLPYVRAPELREKVLAIRDGDPLEEVRRIAVASFRACERHGWNPGGLIEMA